MLSSQETVAEVVGVKLMAVEETKAEQRNL